MCKLYMNPQARDWYTQINNLAAKTSRNMRVPRFPTLTNSPFQTKAVMESLKTIINLRFFCIDALREIFSSIPKNIVLEKQGPVVFYYN